MGNPAKEKNEKKEKHAAPSAKEKSEKHREPSAPPMKEMPDDEWPEQSDLDSSTVTLRKGFGFSVTNNLKPL